uniref:G-protein coupled receptors family 1 profile domain-containing protein n=1 Tax=Gouania willdenowi TaxID=441366 RepID=A0A8C5GYH5_GOUWI
QVQPPHPCVGAGIIYQLFIREAEAERCRAHHLLLLTMSTPDEAELCYPHLGNSSCRRIVRSHSVKLHTPTNFLLLSLAVSDFSVGFVWVFMIFLINGCWFLGAGLCVFHSVLGSVATAASIGTVVLISVDRYVAVCDPMHYQTKVTKNRAKICIVLCWVGSTLFHTVLFKDNIEYPGGFDYCAGGCTVYLPPHAGVMDLIFSFIIPFSIIVVLYAMRSHVTVVTLQSSQKVNRSELKAARALGVVVVVFLMCLTPFYLVLLTTGFGVKNLSSFIFVAGLFFFNSLLNPVIYVFLYPWFRKCVKCVLSLQILKSGSIRDNVLLGFNTVTVKLW